MARNLFTNARVVSPDEVFLGTVEWHAGRIVRVDIGATSVPGAEDLAGDYLLPGLVKPAGLRTAALPRGAEGIAALVETDLVAATCGITTLVDEFDVPQHADATAWAAIVERVAWLGDGAARGTLRCHHAIHWRVARDHLDALPAAFAMLPRHRLGRLVSLVPDALAMIDGIADLARHHSLIVAATDVRSPAEMALCVTMGVDRLMFPGPIADDWPALSALRSLPIWPRLPSHGVPVPPLLGPNDAFDAFGPALDLLSGPFRLRDSDGWSLPAGVAAVSSRAARFAGFQDRGAIAVGQRADFVRVREIAGTPVPVSTWRGGERVA